MLREDTCSEVRALRCINITCDLVVVGGGLAGTCAAISAARAGLDVTLVQDRPVLGGNSSSEVRLWALGATSHMGNNNRWSREGGIVDEILLENLNRNREGNPVIFDTVLLDKVRQEERIQLLLNTSVFKTSKSSQLSIESVSAFCGQNATLYHLQAPLFCDASGDGIVAFQAGAPFRMGAESSDEFGEGFAPNAEFGELLGHSIFFYTKVTEKPVKYRAPSYALKDITKLPRFKAISAQDTGCNFWWIEFGGRFDTILQTEEIKWELWKIIYGIWDYIKNSGKFPESEKMTLEWVGTVPGKRESRRFEGDYIISQRDIVEQREHYDSVALGGWSLDLHPADAVYSSSNPCTQWHSKGVYGIPYRCFYSRTIQNLFLAGRIISATHVAFGSTRVMLTCAHGGVAVGKAAAQCIRKSFLPVDIAQNEHIRDLQDELSIDGQSIPGIELRNDGYLDQFASVSSSSTYSIKSLPADGPWIKLEQPIAQLLPLTTEDTLDIQLFVKTSQNSELKIALRTSAKPGNFTPEETLCEKTYKLTTGHQKVAFRLLKKLKHDQYVFLTVYGNNNIQIACTETRITGLLSVQRKTNKAVSNRGEQIPPKDIGVDRFEFWIPTRRPKGHNLAFEMLQGIRPYSTRLMTNGFFRPTTRTNAWVADLNDPHPRINLKWGIPQKIGKIDLFFDTDFDHALETVQWNHPESVIPFCVQEYIIRDSEGRVIYEMHDNYQTVNRIRFENPVETDQLSIELKHPTKKTPASLFGLRVRA